MAANKGMGTSLASAAGPVRHRLVRLPSTFCSRRAARGCQRGRDLGGFERSNFVEARLEKTDHPPALQPTPEAIDVEMPLYEVVCISKAGISSVRTGITGGLSPPNDVYCS